MKCPYCKSENSKVVDSRPAEGVDAIRRRRECLNCSERFTTYETIEKPNIIVVKKDGTRELFDKDKIMGGVVKASMKRPISTVQMETLVKRVEDRAMNNLSGETPSEQIGEWVMKELKELDDVAYVRFASVYKQFKDVDEFMDELQSMLENHNKS